MLAHSQEPFFVAPRPLWPRQVCAVAGLPAAAAPGRCARSQALTTVHRPVQAQRAAGPNGWQGWGLALAPHLKPHGVYFFLALLDGRGGQVASSEVRAHAPHPPSRARSDPTCTPGRSRTRMPPSACLAPSPRPLRPSLAHAMQPHTCPVRRPHCAPASWAHMLVSGATGSYLEGSCWWRR